MFLPACLALLLLPLKPGGRLWQPALAFGADCAGPAPCPACLPSHLPTCRPSSLLSSSAGANVTFQQFFMNNLLPVTLGNIVAGSVSWGGARAGQGLWQCIGQGLRQGLWQRRAQQGRAEQSSSLLHGGWALSPPNTRPTRARSPNSPSPPRPLSPTAHRHGLQLCMATVYSLLYGSLGRKITGEAKTA